MAGTSDREGFRQGQGSVLAVRVALGAAGVFYLSSQALCKRNKRPGVRKGSMSVKRPLVTTLLHAPATGIRTHGRSVKIVPWATPVLHPVGLGGARAWFCCCGSFGGFSACLTWFQPFSAGLGTATASGFSLPRRRQSPFTTRLPEAPVRVLHSFKAKNSRDNGKFISRSVRY